MGQLGSLPTHFKSSQNFPLGYTIMMKGEGPNKKLTLALSRIATAGHRMAKEVPCLNNAHSASAR